jgi:acetaldehyde dehydrogenase (acetylating)
LRQAVEQLHQQARQAKQMCASSGGQQQMGQDVKQAVLQVEQAADRAKSACQQAGNVDQRTQQAVQQAHQEASSLKKEIQMG